MGIRKPLIYWSMASLEPQIEAISKEVFQLADYFRDSFIFSVNPHFRFRFSVGQRYIGFNPRFYPLLRVMIPLLEFSCSINHVYGESCPWIFSKTLKYRPLVLTIASEKGQPQTDFLARCRKIIVQTETLRRELRALGVDKAKVELLYPAVDLKHFRPKANGLSLSNTPRILFATAPRSREEMQGRGVYLLLQAAKASPDIQYRLLYRQWRSGYTSLLPTEAFIANHHLTNVTLTNGVTHDMSRIYNEHHFTVIPYTQPDGGKECPNSLVESLACGVPVIISSVSRFAYFVEAQQCGVIFNPTPKDLILAIEQGMRRHKELSDNAVATAQKNFSKIRFLHRMEQIYQDILSSK